MINRMKKKPLKMKGTELSAAFKRGREVTIKHLTDMMAASCSQSEDRICRRKMMRKKGDDFHRPHRVWAHYSQLLTQHPSHF